MIYLDNASTSFPKPPSVLIKIAEYLQGYGVTPNRGAHQLTRAAQELIDEARERLAFLLGINKSSRLAFTYNATHSLNIGIKGALKKMTMFFTALIATIPLFALLKLLKERELLAQTYLL